MGEPHKAQTIRFTLPPFAGTGSHWPLSHTIFLFGRICPIVASPPPQGLRTVDSFVWTSSLPVAHRLFRRLIRIRIKLQASKPHSK